MHHLPSDSQTSLWESLVYPPHHTLMGKLRPRKGEKYTGLLYSLSPFLPLKSGQALDGRPGDLDTLPAVCPLSPVPLGGLTQDTLEGRLARGWGVLLDLWWLVTARRCPWSVDP